MSNSKRTKQIVLTLLCLMLSVMLCACADEKGYDDGFNDGYEDGYNDGYDDGKYEIYQEYKDSYQNGYDTATRDYCNGRVEVAGYQVVITQVPLDQTSTTYYGS